MAQIFKGRVYSGTPYPSAEINYEYTRDGANMKYRFTGRVYLEQSSGWYYNNLQLKLYLNGGHIYTKDCKSSSKGWSIDFDSGWHTVSNKVTGTTPFYFTVLDTQNNSWCNYRSSDYTLYVAPAYANITSFTVSKRDETSVSYGFTVDVACDWARYSLDNVNWYDLPNGGVVSGLNANTKYTFYLAVRRTDSGLWSYSNGVQQTTYDYPYCTDSPNFVIGNALTLKFYNPLNRTIGVELLGNGDAIIGRWSGNTDTITGFNDSNGIDLQYSTIPNSQNATYKVRVTYGSSVRTRNNGNTYSIRGDETPTYNNFLYEDGNQTVSTVIGNKHAFVRGLSSIRVIIPSANRMSPVRHANPKNYVMSIDTLSTTVDYSNDGIEVNLGTIQSSGTKRLNVRAYDSRNLSTLAYQDVTVYDYAKPVINIDVARLNNFETQTTLKVSGTYARVNINGTDKNTITSVQYRYREAGGTWSNWTTLNTTVSSGKFTCSDVILSLDNTKSFDFEVQAGDMLAQISTANKTLDIGQAIFFISSNKKACYINGQQIIMYDVVDAW